MSISVSLIAVFIPMAFFPGSTGVIYRQFSVTIVSIVLLIRAGRCESTANVLSHFALISF